jgi:drug/metabolite transporter (DMT)-like permease
MHQAMHVFWIPALLFVNIVMYLPTFLSSIIVFTYSCTVLLLAGYHCSRQPTQQQQARAQPPCRQRYNRLK